MTPLFYDEHLLIVEKPAGLLSVPGRLAEHKDCLITRLQLSYPEALIVHRLDMATSGLMVMARSPDAHRRLSKAFAERQVDKAYEALVSGVMAMDEGQVAEPLITDWPNRPRQMIDYEKGKPSLTLYRVMQRLKDATRVELKPVTGRSHQLRVHMLSLGHAIIGDSLYVPEDPSPRLMLHAKFLSFPHPFGDEVMRFDSPVPF